MNYTQWLRSIDREEFAPINLCQVDEVYLWDTMVKVLKDELLSPASRDFNYDHFQAEDLDGETLVSSLETLPFMSPWRLVVVENLPVKKSQVKTNADLLDALADYAKSPNQTTLLYISFRDKPFAGKAYKAMKKSGQEIHLARLNRPELRGFIKKYLGRHGVQTDGATLAYLADLSAYLDRDSEKNLYDMENMLAKAVGAAEGGRLDQDQAAQVLTDQGEQNIFVLLDALTNRRPQACLEAYRRYLRDGHDPYRLYAMVRRQVRLLLGMRELRRQNFSPADAQRKMGLHPYESKKVYRSCTRFTPEELVKMHEDIFEIEVQSRTSGVEVQDGLLLFLARYSQVDPSL